MRYVIPLLLLLLVGCSDDPTGPSYPNVRGDYNFVEKYTLNMGSYGTQTMTCTGRVSIFEQSEGSFSGSYITNASTDCDASSGTVSGEVRPDGGINFATHTPGNQSSFASIGCFVVSADDQSNGTFANNRITARSDAVLDCSTQAGIIRVIVTLDISATRT